MTNSSVMPPPVPGSRGKAVITQRAALISTLRTWFLYRDEAVWAFVGGTEGDHPLEEIVLGDDVVERVVEANKAAQRAWAIAEKIAKENEQKASSVMREAINELLTNEVPAFLLAVSHIPGSFWVSKCVNLAYYWRISRSWALFRCTYLNQCYHRPNAMASARTLDRLHSAPITGMTPTVLNRQAQGVYPPQYNGYTGNGSPYESTGSGRRLSTWNPTRLGPTTSLWSTRDLMLARCHDEVRNNPLATSAVDNFESQIVGNGIKPKWNLRQEDLKLQIETEFKLSALSKNIDYGGLCDYYGLQALAAREIFEGGEVFARRHIRPVGWSANPNIKQPMRVPLQVQLIEAEQCPIWLNITATPGATVAKPGSVIRTGKEFDRDGRLAAFHMYAEHPGETMFFTSTALRFVRVTSDHMLHCYKPYRAGLLRGQPHLSSVLVLLHELSKYTDATVVAKQIQAMFAAFITKVVPESDVIPTDLAGGGPNQYLPPGVRTGELEPGSINELYPGEDIRFPTLPQNSDLQAFMNVMLHQFCAAIGATYEQVTGDLRGVNLSSIRAGVQDAHRKCEQFIYNVLVTQFCQPTLRWWLDEAVLSGRLVLPGYAEEPEQYLDVTWTPSGWPWINPKDDIEAKQTAVRCGFTSREKVCAESGEDASEIDQQQTRDNQRADTAGLVYDSDPRKILIGKEANPEVPEEGAPEAAETDDAATAAQSGIMRAK